MEMTWNHRTASEAVTTDGRWLVDLPDGHGPWELFFCDGRGDILVGLGPVDSIEEADRMIATGQALDDLTVLLAAHQVLAEARTARAATPAEQAAAANLHERLRSATAEVAVYSGAGQ